MKTSADLKRILQNIDHKSYPAYKDTRGSYQFDRYVLHIDHVQGDPFASPSKVSISVGAREAGFPSECYTQYHNKVAMQDYLLRIFFAKIEQFNGKARGSGKSGLLGVSRTGQAILEKSALCFGEDGSIIVRMEIGFPARGRTIDARELERILYQYLPDCVHQVLYYEKLSKEKIRSVLELAQDQQFIRQQLEPMGLVAFVANGAVLPRESGISDKPMRGSVAFVSPKEYEVTMELPNKGKIKGMGIPKGITLIVGGGYHGKSTLLKALEMGVYNHIAGDGREYVITKQDAMKMRAEDGRSIQNTDISMFINHLPNEKDTRSFSTMDASGSTSQAANVIEAIEAKSSVLLMDEDTSATNFMVRDELMQRVVSRSEEPITPFLERAEYLYHKLGVSIILVAGSSGAYFHIADTIIQMDRYIPKDITKLAKEEAEAFPLAKSQPAEPQPLRFHRACGQEKLQDRIKIKTMGRDGVSINHDTIELRYVEQLADSEQVSALGYMTVYAMKHLFNGKNTLEQIVESVYKLVEEKGLIAVADGGVPCGLAMPRRQEFYACLNRYRKIRIMDANA